MKFLNPKEISEKKDLLRDKLEKLSGTQEERIFKVLTQFVLDKNAKILDCGCGGGGFLKLLYGAGYRRFYATDIDNYLSLISEHQLVEFKSSNLSFDSLPWPENFFDVLTAIQMMEHLENPYNFVRESWRVLKPRGLFIFSMPNIMHIMNRLIFFKHGDMPRYRASNNHITLFPKGVFAKTFLKKFDIVERGFIKGELLYGLLSKFQFPENEWFGRDVYYVLRRKS